MNHLLTKFKQCLKNTRALVFHDLPEISLLFIIMQVFRCLEEKWGEQKLVLFFPLPCKHLVVALPFSFFLLLLYSIIYFAEHFIKRQINLIKGALNTRATTFWTKIEIPCKQTCKSSSNNHKILLLENYFKKVDKPRVNSGGETCKKKNDSFVLKLFEDVFFFIWVCKIHEF